MLQLGESTIAPQRVFCIGCNYGEHIAEMQGDPDEGLVVFMKPPTSLVPAGEAVSLPRGRGEVHHELELVALIGRPGKAIPRAEALDHVAGLSLGLDLTLREVQGRLRKQGYSWELAKAFDQSGPVGRFSPYRPPLAWDGVEMTLQVNDEIRQQATAGEMLYGLDRLIEILSRTWALREGDLVFTGTPAGVGPVAPGDTVTAASPQLGTFTWVMV
jgi:2-keto-4-pentenoate hydratase/2-oxohepta-3-ene-1,7-dioic acid hydratase in catechol pathway